MYIIGIYSGHNASVCLFKDGELIEAVQEERFTKLKNFIGFPTKGLKSIMDRYNISYDDVEKFIWGFYETGKISSRTVEESKKVLETFFRINKPLTFEQKVLKTVQKISPKIADKLLCYNFEKRLPSKYEDIKKQNIAYNEEILGKGKVDGYDHHHTHAASVYGGLCDRDEKYLVFTADGGGDFLSTTLSIGYRGKLEKISETREYRASLGMLYAEVTRYLRMKPLEHEFKVMGMAPYSKKYYNQKTYNIFHDMIGFDEEKLCFYNKEAYTFEYFDYLERKLFFDRFDNICGAVQRFTEDMLIRWVKASIRKTGIKKIALAGGIFMNVKANLVVSEIDEVEEVLVFPSCGDESVSIGAVYAYLLENDMDYKPVGDICLGMDIDDDEVLQHLKDNNYKENYRFTKIDNIESKIAEYLSQDLVVARVSGRMEFGARSLGNRAILANPSSRDIIMHINEKIKGRDFWMPFAPSIKEESIANYIINPKKIKAPYMIFTFHSTDLAQEELDAAIHPYDKTLRPQVVYKDWNPSYHKVISEFEKRTGIGGVLNTSFNLHGNPVASDIQDSMLTMDNSELEYLAIGNIWVEKRNAKK